MQITLPIPANSSLGDFLSLFRTLLPPAHSLTGRYQATFTGPLWLRKTAPTAIALGGLPGWWGKQFTAVGPGESTAVNLVMKNGKLMERFPMQSRLDNSILDIKPALCLTYGRDCPFPWPLVTDELRMLDEQNLLGLTIVKVGLLRKFGFPFLLSPVEKG